MFRWALLGLAALPAWAAPPVFYLPGDVTPHRHTVELTIDPSQSTFEGTMRIEVGLRAPTDTIWLNAKSLVMKEAKIEVAGVAQSPGILTSGGEFLGLQMSSPLGPGSAVLSIRYQGKLDEKLLSGAYRRKVGGDWYVFTTFTPIEARRAFPCFDELRFKTPWDISIRVKRDQTALSNAREFSSTDEPGGWKLVRFAPTEPIASEVVAFAVGPFDVYNGGSLGSGTPVRVITSKGRAAEGVAAAQASAMILPRLEAYTGIPYPFGKLDHLAIPDGEFSAVENPGLITYRVRALLVDPEVANAKARSLRQLEAHEIGHQWFGNLVTQADWRDVWLSEGFATWIADKVMDQEQPPERVHLLAVTTRERIMGADSSPRTRPVRAAVDSRESSGEIYNHFVYDKGAAILLMLEGWLGEEKFRTGIRAYLNAHRFQNASADDLARALRGAAGIDPAPVMHAFLDAGGIPVVKGDVDCSRGGARLKLSQTGSEAVPICYRTANGGQSCEVVESVPRDVELGACPAWVLLNSGGTGYYRTAWTGPSLTSLKQNELSVAERLTLVFDLRAQKTDRNAAREMLKKLSVDPEPEIAQSAREALR